MATKKKAAPAAQRKGEPLSIRIDPKVRYGLELLSRAQRRSVTGVVEWAIAEAFRNETVPMIESVKDGMRKTTVQPFNSYLLSVWSVNEVERWLHLYRYSPDLLTYEEARMIRVLDATGELWADPGIMDHMGKPGRFKLVPVLERWEQLRPILVEASERDPVRALTRDDLERAGLGHL